MTCFWPCAFTIKRSVQTYGLNAMYNPYSANLADVHDRSHVPSQSFSKAAVLTIAVKVLGMPQHTNPLSLN